MNTPTGITPSLTDSLSEHEIVQKVADQAARRITRKVIAALQRMHHTLSGDDSELKTTWDEICVQVQHEESFFWDAYDETVRDYLSGYVDDLARHEREAIWLQTDAGFDWRFDDPDERPAHPVCNDDIVDYLSREYIYREAGRWQNARIRTFIDRSLVRD